MTATSAPARAPTRALDHAPARAVAQLRRQQRYAPFRRVVGPTGYRAAVCTAVTLGGLLGTVVVVVVAAWASRATTPATTVTLAALASLLVCALTARRALGAQARARVTAPPDAGLLRALDVRGPEVFWTYVGRQVVVWHTVVVLADVLLLSAAGPVPAAAWWIVTLPVGSAVLTLGVAARRASTPPTRRSGLAGVGGLVAAALVAGGAGAMAGRALAVVLAHDTVRMPDVVARTLVEVAGPVALLAAAVGVIAGLEGRRRLTDLAWRADRAGQGRRAGRRSPTTEHARMQAMVAQSALAGSVLGIWRTVVLVAAFGAGMVAAGTDLPPALRGVLGPMLTGYAFVTVLVASGVVFSVVGPSVMIARFRFLWENSSDSASELAVRGLAYPVMVVVAPSMLLAAAQSVLLSQVCLRTLALGITLVGSAVVAETVLPVAHHDDGTITHHPLTAWVVLLVSVPAAAVPAGVVGGVVSMVYALICLGAGHRCLTRRILHLPSSSVA